MGDISLFAKRSRLKLRRGCVYEERLKHTENMSEETGIWKEKKVRQQADKSGQRK